jgi:hypothetical protein
MPSLTKRVWKLPNGEDWVTYRVEWKEHGAPRRKPFLKFSEAAEFMAKLARELKVRKTYGRAPARVDRAIRIRPQTAEVIPFPRRKR